MAADPETPVYLSLPAHGPAAGDRLHLHRWLPAGDPRAVVLIVHGFGGHAGRYADLASRFTRAGYAVYGVDNWGHGLSDGRRGYVPHFSVYLQGVDALLARVKEEQGLRPRFLLGHSLGGLVCTRYLAQAQHEFRAAAMSGPALAMNPPLAPATRLLVRILSFCVPRLGVWKFDPVALTRNSAIAKRYWKDPLVYPGRMSARVIGELVREMSAAQAEASRLHLPILIQHGSADRLIDPSGSEAFFMGLSSRDRRIKIYDGLYHDIYNEAERDLVIADLMGWFEKHIA